MILLYKSNLKKAVRRLRTNTTETEELVWSMIRGKKLRGMQFYRQKIIGSYIVDFDGNSKIRSFISWYCYHFEKAESSTQIKF